METFRRGRDFAAWTGLVPVQRSTGGKQILGRMSKIGQRDIPARGLFRAASQGLIHDRTRSRA